MFFFVSTDGTGKGKRKEQIVTTHHNKTGISLPSSETNRVNSSTLLEIEWNGLPPPETPRVNSSTLTEMAWNSLSCVMQSFYDWLTFGIGGLRHINVNRFSARSITWSVEGVSSSLSYSIKELTTGTSKSSNWGLWIARMYQWKYVFQRFPQNECTM